MKILKTIPFSEFYMWDVKRYNYVFNSSFENAILLRDILTPYKVKVTKQELLKNDWQIIKKINFQGELFLRDINEIKAYKGSLNKVPENSIIYSKINVRHGCVYYHEKGEIPFGVSTEYPTFTFDESKINGYYLKRVLRSDEFKKLLNTKTSGISKARVKVDEFLDIKIPLPNLEEQNRIVANYNTKIQLAKQQEKQAKNLEINIENYLFEVLGIERLKEKKKQLLQIISYSKFDRWDNSKSFILKSKYPVKKVAEILIDISTGTTPPTARKEYFDNGDINFYTPADLTDKMYLKKSVRKVTQLAFNERKARKFKKDTLLFVGIGSTVGKVGIIKNDFATSNQQITGLSLNLAIVNIEFVYYYFNNFIHITTKEKTQATIPIVNQNKILNIPIPIPPIEIQKDITSHIANLKQQIQYLKNQAEQNKIKAIKDFEEEIFITD